jgi:hypothetical protein
MDDWRIQQFYTTCLNKEVQWGVDDCLHSAGTLSQIIKGYDPIAAIRHQWVDEKSATEFELKFGRTRIRAALAIAKMLGYKRIDPADAVVGDMGVVRCDDAMPMSCLTPDGWFCRAPKGFLILGKAVAAWRI